jgi:DNA-binding NtrC family response regulator
MKKPKILIIDDEFGSCEALKMILKEKYDVVTLTTTEESMRVIELENPNLIILDIVMPNMDGLEILSKIKENEPNIPVLIITASRSSDVLLRSLHLGAFNYLTKPFDIEEVKVFVDKALEYKNLLDELKQLKQAAKIEKKDEDKDEELTNCSSRR